MAHIDQKCAVGPIRLFSHLSPGKSGLPRKQETSMQHESVLGVSGEKVGNLVRRIALYSSARHWVSSEKADYIMGPAIVLSKNAQLPIRFLP